MGVPKFFRYVSERYPCLSELAREQRIPKFDNLYLDMNGIIHNCSHPDDSNIHFNITEEEMFRDMFNYVDKLFFLIKPRKLFFMAVDGVAPRAKMNQQRSRRFRSAKEAEILEKQALCRGEVRAHERFDSNCITPGTEFMDRLHEALRYFIKSKISSDPLWQKCRVILSGQDVSVFNIFVTNYILQH
uniref:Xrn1 N-terminal domain-containing protein n=1 Tax=Glossina palpalis gambiensis TaxID=67801 RepID=A0A1B0BK06_9MUSC